ncbi:hypothetical protein [Flavicella marina]|uniref:hypothetical protein n=1 Tax=Flavicella marina TaxID=1475951 RepID=UPI001265283A|nr:hypothetical protein [Flavicella marina]
MIGLEKTEQQSLLFVIVPIIAGISYENRKLSSDWKVLLLKIFSSIIIGMFAFIYDKQNGLITFSDRLQQSIEIFILAFVAISSFYHNKKTTLKLTEGNTLLYSLSFVYWIIAADFTIYNISILGISIISFPIMYSIFHAITKTKLTNKSRLYLSIWSSAIILFFSINYLLKLSKNYNPENIFLNLGEFFILGVSLIYMFQNAVLILGYLLTDKNDELKQELNNKHISRYSSEQVNTKDSVIVIIFCGCVYSANFLLELTSSETLIWIVFIITPFLIKIKNLLKTKAQ